MKSFSFGIRLFSSNLDFSLENTRVSYDQLTILNLLSVMRLCNENFNTNIYSSKEVLYHLDFFIFLSDILTNKF